MKNRTRLLRFYGRALVTLLTMLSTFGPARAEGLDFLGQAKALAPKTYDLIEVQPGDKLSYQLDELTLRILATRSGKWFCRATTSDVARIHRTFFLNRESAEKALTICKGRFSESVHLPFPKRYVLFVTDETDFKANGWTSPRNETYLYLNRQELTGPRLLQNVIHELAISFDRKEQIGFFGALNWPRLGLVEDENTCSLLKQITHPIIKNTLSTVRAFQVEAEIMEQLGIAVPPGLNEFRKLGCIEKVSFMFPHIRKLQPAFKDVSLAYQISRNACSASPEINESEVMNVLKTAEFTLGDGTKQNVCEFLVDVTPFKAGTSFKGGPGPRVSGGW